MGSEIFFWLWNQAFKYAVGFMICCFRYLVKPVIGILRVFAHGNRFIRVFGTLKTFLYFSLLI